MFYNQEFTPVLQFSTNLATPPFLRSKLLTTQSAARRIAYKQLSHYAKYLSIVEPLPTSLPSLPYNSDQTFVSNVRYWCAQNRDAEVAAARDRSA